MAAWSDGEWLAGAIDGAMGAISTVIKGVEGLGNLAINGVGAITSVFGAKGSATEQLSDAGPVTMAPDHVMAGAAKAQPLVEKTIDVKTAMATLGQNITSTIEAIREKTSLPMQDMGDTMKLLANSGPPNVQAGMPGIMQGAGQGRFA